jgi:hypothetical protein
MHDHTHTRQIAGVGLSLDEAAARLTAQMTEEQANEDGVFDCPTRGRFRDASELTPEEANEGSPRSG